MTGLIVVLAVLVVVWFVMFVVATLRAVRWGELVEALSASKGVLSRELDEARADLMESRRTVRRQGGELTDNEARVAELERQLEAARQRIRWDCDEEASRRFGVVISAEADSTAELVESARRLIEQLRRADEPEGVKVLGMTGAAGWVRWRLDRLNEIARLMKEIRELPRVGGIG